MTDWYAGLLAICNADDNDPRADRNRPPEVVDAGLWRGPTAEEWRSRFSLPVDVEIRRASFRQAPHAGGLPVIRGGSLSRRRVERTRVA